MNIECKNCIHFTYTTGICRKTGKYWFIARNKKECINNILEVD